MFYRRYTIDGEESWSVAKQIMLAKTSKLLNAKSATESLIPISESLKDTKWRWYDTPPEDYLKWRKYQDLLESRLAQQIKENKEIDIDELKKQVKKDLEKITR